MSDRTNLPDEPASVLCEDDSLDMECRGSLALVPAIVDAVAWRSEPDIGLEGFAVSWITSEGPAIECVDPSTPSVDEPEDCMPGATVE